ncbi:MAG: metallophosphoesterase family protein [Phycisphaerae bacterium]|nr:metallophosphoesterase family protein [Phycisphaerae bacterium]
MTSRFRRIAFDLAIVLAAWTPDLLSGAEVRIRRLALMTLTDASAVLTWETNLPADTKVRYGTRRGALDRIASGAGDARFHYCEITGLEPGTEYHYVCQSGSAKLALAPMSPGSFKTLVPPPGKERFAFAQMTDTHVGQTAVARYATASGKVFSEGVRWPDPNVRMIEVAVAAAVDEINARKVSFTVIKGDLTDRQSEIEAPIAKRLYDRLSNPYHVVRGNHDRLLEPILRTFGLALPWYSFDHEGFHFVVIDTEPMYGRSPATREVQHNWLTSDLQEHRDKYTLIFGHRPILQSLERPNSNQWGQSLYDLARRMLIKRYGKQAAYAMDFATGKVPQVREPDARRFAALARTHGRVVGVFAGHLHRNFVGTWPQETGNLPYIETASTKEYPCGYAITRVFDGGYMQSYFPLRDPKCLEWSAMTQDAYAKLGYGGKVGPLSDRNFVVRFNRLDLKPRQKDASP